MEPENFQKENNNHTLTNILLFLVLLVVVIILFLMVKNQKKESSEIVYVPAEKFPQSNPVINPPIPTPESNPPITPTQQNIPLVERQNYLTTFASVDGHSKSYKYCGERLYDQGDDVQPQPYYYFMPVSYDCADMEPSGELVQYISKNQFLTILKPTTTKTQVGQLATQYSSLVSSVNGNTYTISVNLDDNPYNVYTIAKIFYDSGYFSSVHLKDIRTSY
jgi:hypothetical protein